MLLYFKIIVQYNYFKKIAMERFEFYYPKFSLSVHFFTD